MKGFKLEPADILVNINREQDPWSVIKRWAVGEYLHVFMYMGKLSFHRGRRRGIRVPMLFESFGRGVCLRLLSERYGEEVVVMRLIAGFDRRRIPHILSEALRLASDPQAYFDYYCYVRHILPRVILEKLRLPIPLSWHRDARQICSEAVLEICLRAGVPVLPDNIVPLPGDFVTSSDLLEQVGQGELSEGWV